MSGPRILFVAVDLLAADGSSASELALEQEFEAIQRELLLTPHRDFELIHARAVTVDDIMRHLIEQRPLVLHFAGHGAASHRVGARSPIKPRDIGKVAEDSENGIYLRDEQDRPQLVTIRALMTMIKSAAPSVRLVVLNACYSDTQAEALCDAVDCVISMAGAVGDNAARSFSAGLYRALGNRRSVGNAFAHAVATLDGRQFPDKSLPMCRTRNRIDADQMFLARRRTRKRAGSRPNSTLTKRRMTAIAGATIALALVAAAAGIGALLQIRNRVNDIRKGPSPSLNYDEVEIPGNPKVYIQPRAETTHPMRSAPAETQKEGKKTQGQPQRTQEDQGKIQMQNPSKTRKHVQCEPTQADIKAPDRSDPPQDLDEAIQANAKGATPTGSLEELDQETIRRYIKYYHDRIRYCYEKQRLTKPTLTGTVTAQFLITSEGTVESPVVNGMDGEVSSCVAGVIKDIEFPKSGGNIRVTYPFHFV